MAIDKQNKCSKDNNSKHCKLNSNIEQVNSNLKWKPIGKYTGSVSIPIRDDVQEISICTRNGGSNTESYSIHIPIINLSDTIKQRFYNGYSSGKSNLVSYDCLKTSVKLIRSVLDDIDCTDYTITDVYYR